MDKKNTSVKLTDAEVVAAYMEALQHPLKEEIEAVRKIIRSNKLLSERIKWNAPSYYFLSGKEGALPLDLVTFNPRDQKRICLVFHHPAIVKIKSDLLEGDYKDRRLVYFESMASIRKHSKALKDILANVLTLMKG